MRRRSWWMGMALLALLGAAACGKREAADEAASDKSAAQAPSAADSGRVVLAPGVAEKAGIVVGEAGPAVVDVTIELPGEVKPDSSRVQIVKPRFGGVVHALQKKVGDRVRRGETVATIQSNESLTDYAVTAAMPGRVVARGASVGETVTPEASLYTIVELTRVWVDFALYAHQVGSIRQGQLARIAAQAETGPRGEGKVSYVDPMLDPETHASRGRIVLANPKGLWQPGLFVTVVVVIDHANVPVAVPEEAIVRTEEGAAVFVVEGDGYRLQPVVARRSDGRLTEIVHGLAAGTRVVVRNAFVLKAELEKSSEEE